MVVNYPSPSLPVSRETFLYPLLECVFRHKTNENPFLTYSIRFIYVKNSVKIYIYITSGAYDFDFWSGILKLMFGIIKYMYIPIEQLVSSTPLTLLNMPNFVNIWSKYRFQLCSGNFVPLRFKTLVIIYYTTKTICLCCNFFETINLVSNKFVRLWLYF